jgi:hypothetical protein
MTVYHIRRMGSNPITCFPSPIHKPIPGRGKMALTLTPVKASRSRLTPEEIPADAATAVEEAYKYCADNTERLEAALATKSDAEEFLHAMRSYAYHRKPRLVVSGNVTQKGAARFRVTSYTGTAGDEENE